MTNYDALEHFIFHPMRAILHKSEYVSDKEAAIISKINGKRLTTKPFLI